MRVWRKARRARIVSGSGDGDHSVWTERQEGLVDDHLAGGLRVVTGSTGEGLAEGWSSVGSPGI